MGSINDDLAELYGGPSSLSHLTSIFAHIEQGLKDNPDGPATIVPHQSPDHLQPLVSRQDNGSNSEHTIEGTPKGTKDCLQWTYTELHQAAVNLTAGLSASGIQPGMRVATLIPNRVEFPLLLWTSTILRVTLCLLDPGAVTKPRREELTKLMTTLEPDVVVVLNEDGAQAIDEVFSQTGSSLKIPGLKVVLEQNRAPADWTTILDVGMQGKEQPVDERKLLEDARNDDPDRTAHILFTSGTSTGNPKGCPRSVSNTAKWLSSQHSDAFCHGRRGANDHFLASSMNFRIIAPSLHFATWMVGGCAVMSDPTVGMQGQIAAIRDHKVNFILFIPALLHAMIAHPEFENLDVSNVTRITIGGDMITKSIFKMAQEHFPQANMAVGHGMTEGGGMYKWSFFETPVDEVPYFNDLCPLGVVCPGDMIRIRDPDNGQTMKRYEAGELCVCSPKVINHYIGQQHEDAFFEDEHGRWFRTGDLGMINQDGVVYILGRIKDIIKRSGIPITPAALENCISTFTGVTASVLAWPHPTLGQEPLVVLEHLNGKTEDEIREEVLLKFGKDYALGPVLTLKQLGLTSFPLNATGKIMKSELLTCAQNLTQ